MIARPLTLSLLLALLGSASALASLLVWQIDLRRQILGLSPTDQSQEPTPQDDDDSGDDRSGDDAGEADEPTVSADPGARRAAAVGVLVSVLVGGATFALAVVLGAGEGAESIVPLVVGVVVAVVGSGLIIGCWKDWSKVAPRPSRRDDGRRPWWLPIALIPGSAVLLAVVDLVIDATEGALVTLVVLALVATGSVVIARAAQVVAARRRLVLTALWGGLALSVLVFTIADAAMEDEPVDHAAPAAQPSDAAAEVDPDPEPEPESPPEPEAVVLEIPADGAEVATNSARLLIGDQAEPVDPASLGVADPLAVAYVNDGMAVVEMSAGLGELSQCAGVVNPLSEGPPQPVLAGPGCPAPGSSPLLANAVAAGAVLASEDWGVMVLSFDFDPPLDAVGVLIPLEAPAGLAVLEGTTGVRDRPPPGVAELPAADTGDRFVLSAPGRSFDGTEVVAL